MPEPIRFSVVIPTFNRGSLVGRAVTSALEQTCPPAEVLVVDDGSTDDTAEAVAAMGEAVRYLHQTNGGVASARNHGVRVASNRWIAFLDSDDTWFPDHLERMAAAITATEGAATMYFGDTLRSGRLEGTTQWGLTGFTVDGPHHLVDDGADWVLLPYHPMMTQSVVVGRRAYLDVGGSDVRLPVRSDTHLWLKLGLGKPLCAVAGLGGHVRSDDVTGHRLTDRRGTTAYQRTTILLYEDILAGGYPVRPEHLAEMQRRISVAHWNLGRALLRERHVLPAARHGITGAAMAPADTVRRVLRNRQSRQLAVSEPT